MNGRSDYLRVVVDPPADFNLTGPFLARTARQVMEMQRLHAGGVSVHEIARRFELHVRTVYRYLKHEHFAVVRMGHWEAVFQARSDQPPTQASSWVWVGEGEDPRERWLGELSTGAESRG